MCFRTTEHAVWTSKCRGQCQCGKTKTKTKRKVQVGEDVGGVDKYETAKEKSTGESDGVK